MIVLYCQMITVNQLPAGQLVSLNKAKVNLLNPMPT